MEAPHVNMGRGFDAPDEALLVEHPFFVHMFRADESLHHL